MRGWDPYKRVMGRKRHLLVDTNGWLMVLRVTAANVQDRHPVMGMLWEAKASFPRLQKVWVDDAYDGLQQPVQDTLDIDLELVSRPDNSQGFQVLPRRWVAERSLAWLGRCRRLGKDYERLLSHSESFIYLAMSRLMFKRLARAGQV